MVDNAERAISAACEATQAWVENYTAAPVYFQEGAKGKHEWLIEFKSPPPAMQTFVNQLDVELKALNSDYEAKRYKDMTLLPPKVHKARSGLFYEWLESKKKLGGQHKVPRLSNCRSHLEELLALN